MSGNAENKSLTQNVRKCNNPILLIEKLFAAYCNSSISRSFKYHISWRMFILSLPRHPKSLISDETWFEIVKGPLQKTKSNVFHEVPSA